MSGERSGHSDEDGWWILRSAARLLLEYNERSALVTKHLDRLAAHLGIAVSTVVTYRAVTLATRDGRMFRAGAPELRINMAVSIGTLRAIDDLCAGRTSVDETKRRLEFVERDARRHPSAVVAGLFGLAAAALAALLGADWAAIGASGVSAALGLLARQQVARNAHTLLLAPFTAACVGAIVGGLVIRSDWTATPHLALIVPALMLVPGPHLINGIEDVLENEIQSGLCRLCLAVTILLAAAVGVVAGLWMTIGTVAEPAASARAVAVPLLNVLLAGSASAGFAAFQNSPWRVVWVSVVCGALGYATRASALALGLGLAPASLAACLAIGIASGLSSRRLRLPFAAAAFAAAAPLVPGVLIYRSIAGAIRLATPDGGADPALAVAMLSPFIEAAFVVGAMVSGLVIGARLASLVQSLIDRRASTTTERGCAV